MTKDDEEYNKKLTERYNEYRGAGEAVEISLKFKIHARWIGGLTVDKKANVGVVGLKVEHPEWYSATGPLGLRDFQIDTCGVKDVEMECHFVQNMNSGTINRLDDQNRRDMRNWSDLDEDGE